MTKVLVGGPSGGIGSNEIILGKEKIIAIIDESGVLYDPKGINRKELLRLCGRRIDISNFNKARLSNKAFYVSVNDTNITLPNGDLVESGEMFRDTFHLNPMLEADYFIPCGGNKDSINMQNVEKMFKPQEKNNKNKFPRFPFIVEGADLFLTEPARVVLQEAGCVLFKDSSTNKGSVTGSSYEVLAGMAFDDE